MPGKNNRAPLFSRSRVPAGRRLHGVPAVSRSVLFCLPPRRLLHFSCSENGFLTHSTFSRLIKGTWETQADLNRLPYSLAQPSAPSALAPARSTIFQNTFIPGSSLPSLPPLGVLYSTDPLSPGPAAPQGPTTLRNALSAGAAVQLFGAGFDARLGLSSLSPGPGLHRLRGFGFNSTSSTFAGPALSAPLSTGSDPSVPNFDFTSTSTSTSTPTPTPTAGAGAPAPSLARQQDDPFTPSPYPTVPLPFQSHNTSVSCRPPNPSQQPHLPFSFAHADADADANPDDLFGDIAAATNFSPPANFLPPASPPHHPTCERDNYSETHSHPGSTWRTSQLPLISPSNPPAYRPCNLEAALPVQDGILQDKDGLDELGELGELDGNGRIPVGSLLDDMPAATSRKRTRTAAALDDIPAGPSSLKRSRSQSRASASGRPTSSRGRRAVRNAHPVVIPDSDDVFADVFSVDDDDDDEHKLFDLTKGDNIPEELITAKEDKSTKLGKFECIICMDSATNLTVTHCGM